MRVLDAEKTAAKVGLSTASVWAKSRIGEFPKPVELTKARRGWLEHEVDAWIAARVEARDTASAPTPIAAGRRRFWEDVRAGKRLHPRTASRLKREAAELEKATPATPTAKRKRGRPRKAVAA